ncbi:MAG TPA: FG-GAP-like repeat-containing protein [Candidatus Acidoferrum sp.]
MKARQWQYGSDFVGKIFGRITRWGKNGLRGDHGVVSRGVSRRMRGAACALLLLGVAVSVTLAGRAAQTGPASAATPNSTSLNGPGNIFLTANLIANPGAGNGSAVSLAVADFNGDAKQDIAVTSQGCNTCGVTILRGNGDGTFQAPLFTANLGGPYYVAAGDFNGDGKQDLAVIGALTTNLNVPAVYILLGNGDGTFTLKSTLTGFTTPESIVLGDFNGDGKLDMAVSESQPGSGTPSSVLVFLGNGDGTMQVPISTTVTGLGVATNMAGADFNKDNKLDLVLTEGTNGANGHIVVLLGNGNGTFQASRSFATTGGGWDVAVGDFNGDGIPDIVATATLAQTVDIFLGKGNGDFQPAVAYSAGLLGGETANIAVGDFNKDGKLDIITSIGGAVAAAGSSVSVLLGKGDGTFLPASLVASNQESGQLVVADFNGDGNPDWIAGKANGTLMTLALGNGDGTFRAGVNYALGAGPFVTLGDVNKDGKLDVVAVDVGSNDVRVLLGKGDGTFLPAIITPVPGAYYGIAVADLNGDGNQDVVVGDSTGGAPRNVIVLLGKGDGTFAAPARFTTGGSGEGLILAEDFNGDGKLDIAVVNESDNTVSILLGNGDGTFQAPKITPALATDGFLGAMAAADLNGDGKLDLVVPDWVGSASGKVAILLGNGDGTFQAPTFLTSNGGSTWPVLADFNKDGKLDLAVANQFGTIDVFLGNGNGTFNTPLVLNDVQTNIGNPIPISLAVGDFNLDDNLDLLVGPNLSDIQANPFTNVNVGLQLFLGNGDGTFTGPQDYLAGGQCNPVLVGDFNGDGAPDVAAGDTSENFVSILLNQTPPPVTVSPKSLTFANQFVSTTSATQPITITNNGAAATTMAIAVSGDFSQTNTCPVSPATLAVAANCTVNVAFKPTATGVRNGAITVTHQLAGSPQSVALSGTGVAPIVTLGGNSLGFGNQNVGTISASKMVSLSNTGTASLTISSIAITGANAGDFAQTNTCGGSVAAGANCSINVTFKPTATGNRSASVSITDNASGSPQSVSLTGTGTTPVVMLSMTSINFAGQLVTTASAGQNVTLTNNGSATLNITSITITGANSGDFSETNTCGASVAAAANCTISVTFKPTATANRAASVTTTDDAAGSPQAVALTGTGTDFTPGAANGGSTSASVTAGQSATYNLQVSPVSGFNGTVALSCSGAPSLASCTVSPASVTPNGTVASGFTATVTTTAPSMIVPRSVPHDWPPLTRLRLIFLLVFAITLLAILRLFRDAAKLPRRRLALAPALALVLMMLAWIGGCGGGGGGGQHNPGTPKGTSTLTVTGTSGGVSHTLNLTLTVN